MMNKFLAALAVFLFFSCASNQSKKEKSSSVNLVSLAPSISDCILYLSPDLEELVACTNYDTSQAFKKIPKIQIYPLNTEALLTHKADCVLVLKGFNAVASLDFMSEKRIGYYVQDASSFTAFFNSLEDIASMLKDTAQAKQRARKLKAEFENLKISVSPLKMMAIVSVNPIFIHGMGSYFDQLVKHLTGGGLVAPNNGLAYPQMSPEQVMEMNPDFLIFSNEGMRDDFFKTIPLFKQLNAFKNDNILIYDENCMSRPSSDCVDCLRALKAEIESSQGIMHHLEK